MAPNQRKNARGQKQVVIQMLDFTCKTGMMFGINSNNFEGTFWNTEDRRHAEIVTCFKKRTLRDDWIPLTFSFFINLQFTNSNWFRFLIYVRSQISCNPQSLICYYAKELMKTKSSKKIWYQGHSSKWPYCLTNLDSFLREQTQSAHSWPLFYYFIHSNKFIVYTCAYVINLLYPQPGHLFV